MKVNLRRVYAIILRYMFLFRRSYDRLTDAFYWPVIDLFVWGLTSSYLKSFAPKASPIILMVVSGILLWLIVWRAQYEISGGILEDLWNKNLINIFVSPLTFLEWNLAFITVGLIKIIVSVPFAMLVAYLLYHVQIFLYGFYLIPFAISLTISGWWIGFLVAGIILRYGTKVQTIAWASVGLISPFAAIYYPVSILPMWAQKIAYLIPMTYIFEGSRQIIFQHKLDPEKLIMSFVLNAVYLIATIIFVRSSFKKILNKGLIRLA